MGLFLSLARLIIEHYFQAVDKFGVTDYHRESFQLKPHLIWAHMYINWYSRALTMNNLVKAVNSYKLWFHAKIQG